MDIDSVLDALENKKINKISLNWMGCQPCISKYLVLDENRSREIDELSLTVYPEDNQGELSTYFTFGYKDPKDEFCVRYTDGVTVGVKDEFLPEFMVDLFEVGSRYEPIAEHGDIEDVDGEQLGRDFLGCFNKYI